MCNIQRHIATQSEICTFDYRYIATGHIVQPMFYIISTSYYIPSIFIGLLILFFVFMCVTAVALLNLRRK